MISSNAILPTPQNNPRETRTVNFQMLLTPTEHKNLSAIAEVYGISRGSYCRLGLNGLMEQSKRELASTTQQGQGLPVEVDQFWQDFRKL